MKYQSELIKEIVESRGHELSSPHYESECVEKWLEEAKGAYPKLCDYQSEWLNYINENPLGEFPYETVTDVTEATVNNVVPYEYKTAILKGNTDENLQSVKMPVLKTVGKNLFDVNAFAKKCGGTVSDNEYDSTGSINDSTYDIFIPKGSTVTYVATQIGTVPAASSFALIRKDGTLWHRALNSFEKYTFQTTEDYVGIKTTNYSKNWKIKDFQIEEGSQATSYEPYKSIILTVNEDIELRGVGDVQDTLNCLTGEIVESIGEGVLNGSEEWILNSPKEQPNHWCFHNDQKLAGEKLLISDRIPQSDIDGDRESIRGGGTFTFVYISKEKVEGNVNSFKQWLSQNPIKYQYRKSEKSVKTVELNIQDQDGNTLRKIKPIEGTMHIHSDGTPLKPSITMEIPVEATTQNLSSFIKEE